MYHLATHDDDRQRVAALAAAGEPMDDVVEELLRFYAVPELGRKVTQDIEVGGELLKASDLVLFPLVAATRDEVLVAGADHVDLGRGGRSVPHLAFGGGPHRCLGSHLARIEMDVALAAWHAVIPEYTLGAHDGPLAYQGSVHGMFALPLTDFAQEWQACMSSSTGRCAPGTPAATPWNPTSSRSMTSATSTSPTWKLRPIRRRALAGLPRPVLKGR